MGSKERVEPNRNGPEPWADLVKIVDPPRESKGVVGDLSRLLGGNLTRVIFSLGAAFLMARMLAPENLAPFSLFQMVADLSVTFVGTWSAGAIVRFGREELLRTGSLSQTVTVRVAVVSIMFLLFCVVFVSTLDRVQSFIGLPLWILVLLPAVVLALVLLESTNQLFVAESRFKLASIFGSVQKGVFFVGAGVVFLAGIRESPDWIGICLVASALVGALWALSRVKWKKILPLRISGTLSKRYLRFSIPIFFNAVALGIINWVDLAVLKSYLGDAAVGEYHMAYVGFNMLGGVGLAIGTLFLPKLVSLRVQEKHLAVRHYAQLVVPYIGVLWSFVLMIGILIVPHAIPVLLGPRYEATIMPLQILMCAAMFHFLQSASSPMIGAFDLTGLGTIANIAAALVNIVLDVTLVPVYGIAGAAWATCAAMVTSFAGFAIVVHRRIPLWDKAWYLPLVSSAVGLTIVLSSPSPLVGFSAVFLAVGLGIVIVRKFGLVDIRVIEILGLVDVSPRVQRMIQTTIRILMIRHGRGNPE